MSALILLTQDLNVTASLLHPLLLPLEGDGILDMLEKTNTRARSLARAASITIAIIFVIVAAVASRMSAARVIVALLAAGLFIWGVFSVTEIKDRIGNDLDGESASIQLYQPTITQPADDAIRILV